MIAVGLSTEEIIDKLKIYDFDYHSVGQSTVSDEVYDKLRRLAFSLDSQHPYFTQVGSDVRGGKIKLPYAMGSLDQIYDGEVGAWVKKYNLASENIVDSDKLDGVSCLIEYRDGVWKIGYSRGNGVEGADISRHLRRMPSLPKTIQSCDYIAIRGEIIMRNSTFGHRNYISEYKTARALVAGSMNRTTTKESILADIDFVAYEVVAFSDDLAGVIKDKMSSLEWLRTNGFNTVTYRVHRGSDLNDSYLTKCLQDARRISDYELDGIVCTINAYDDDTHSKRNAVSLNPEHSIKYKIVDANSIVTTQVVAVLWELSKSGWWMPRVQIKPVQLFGTTVTYASGYNARFISENGIGPGAVVEITKAGSVIPEILSVLSKTAPMMPSGVWDWNSNKVQAVCTDPKLLGEITFKNVLSFIESIEVDQLRESTLREVFDKMRLYDETLEEILKLLFDLSDVQWNKYVGANGIKIHSSLRRRLSNMKLPVFLGSLNHFGVGFGIRKATALLEQADVDWLRTQGTPTEIAKLSGFDTTTATQVVTGFPKAIAFWDELVADGTIVEVKEVKTSELADLNVVFTGFRDGELEEKITKMGGKIGSGVSSKTTHLLVASFDGKTSSKAKKALDLGVALMTSEEFKDNFNI